MKKCNERPNHMSLEGSPFSGVTAVGTVLRLERDACVVNGQMINNKKAKGTNSKIHEYAPPPV